MPDTIRSIYFLIKIIWNISSNLEKIKILFILLISIFSSIIQYINIILTALTFSYITSLGYKSENIIDFQFIFGNRIEIHNYSFIKIILIWILCSILAYGTLIISSYLIYKTAYNLGKSLSIIILKIAIRSNSIFYELISEKTLFNLLTSENTILIKGPIMSLISLPMQIITIILLLSILINYSSSIFLVLPVLAILYLFLTNLLLKSVRNNSEIVFDLRSSQTDMLSRLIDNYLDVSFPPSGKAYRNLFQEITSKLRNLEAYNATIPRILKSILELCLILIIGSYIIYNIYILKLPIELFISSSAAVILSLFKITPIISGLSSTLVSFDDQYESIRSYFKLIFKSNQYDLYSNSYNYSEVHYGKKYLLNFNKLYSKRIKKLSSKNTLSININNEKLLWVLGESGCGKSTLLSMVAGIRPIPKGSINLFINKEKQKKSSQLMHENVAYMPQKPIFHSITVLEYIKDGDQKISNLKVKKVINDLKIEKSFGISINSLLDLVVGPRGYNPSGGQGKLLAFARTLCKRNIYLYLLDEPTSDLNPELKQIVLKLIYEIAKEKIILCITHDKSVIRSNDGILHL